MQGLGACAGMVVPRAIVRDLHTGTEAARLMSLLMLVFSVSPILAPLTGSVVIETFGWRAVFWVVTGAALLATVLLATRAEGDAAGRACASTARSAPRSPATGFLLGDRNFLGLTFIGGFGIASFFVYLASSSFILIDHYGLSPTVYSVFFSINAVAFIGMSQLTGMLTERFGLQRVVRVAVVGYATTMVALFAVMASGVDQLAVHGGAAVRRLRLPRPGHPDDVGAGHGRAWRDRRHGVGADGHAAFRDRRGRPWRSPGCSSTARRCR